MHAECHVWKTADGRLVPESDPDAAFLVYAPGDEVPAEDRDAVKAVAESTSGSEGQDGEDRQGSQPHLSDQPTKQGDKPADKQAKRGGDK